MARRSVFSLAAYITGGVRSGTAGLRRRHVARSCPPKLTESGVKAMKEGGISGMNGIIIGMAELLGMDGACLLGETSGYLVDPVASQAVLEALSQDAEAEDRPHERSGTGRTRRSR